VDSRHGQGEKMAIIKEEIADKIEVLESGHIQVRIATVIKEDGTELTRSFTRHVLSPSTKDSGSWEDTDISGEKTSVQAICNAAWTSAVKTAYQIAQDASVI